MRSSPSGDPVGPEPVHPSASKDTPCRHTLRAPPLAPRHHHALAGHRRFAGRRRRRVGPRHRQPVVGRRRRATPSSPSGCRTNPRPRARSRSPSTLPTDHPFASVSVKQVPGWTVVPDQDDAAAPVTEGDTDDQGGRHLDHLDRRRRAPRSAPGEFAEFDISAGPVPDVGIAALPDDPDLQRRRGRGVERADPGVR